MWNAQKTCLADKLYVTLENKLYATAENLQTLIQGKVYRGTNVSKFKISYQVWKTLKRFHFCQQENCLMYNVLRWYSTVNWIHK